MAVWGIPLLLAPAVRADDSVGEPAANLDIIKEHIAPLTHPLGDRLPVLAWHSAGVPTGLEAGSVPEVWDTYLARGIVPLCNAVGNEDAARQYLPIFRHIAAKGHPIVFLAQGWVQRLFMNRDHPERGCPHLPPARQDKDLPCPAYMMATSALKQQAAGVEATCRVLKQAGLAPRMILIDYESAAYLRNGADAEERVTAALAEARKCSRCLRRFGAERLAGPEEYRKVVDEARAFTIRAGVCEPARRVFPDLLIGNFYAWPVEREQPRQAGIHSAYGWPGSGMNVAQPRCYVPAGWGGAGRSQEKIDWNTFYYCLSSFSRARKVLREGEILVPWFHLFHQGRYQPRIQEGTPLPSLEACREMVRHMMLRGTETFALFTDGRFRGSYPPDFRLPLVARVGQWVYDVMAVQPAFDEMLAYNDFLRRGRVLNLDVTGEYSRLDETTATWSGVATDERALVRTVSFGPALERTVRVFGRAVKLPFGSRGQFFWIDRTGKVTPVTD